MRIAETRERLAEERAALGTVALVPTMGALHEGHRSLIRLAHQYADDVVVSVFVNPLQFGPDEDFSRYPRTFDADVRACAEEGVRLVFAPSPEEMYTGNRQVTVSAGPMGDVLEGEFRPGHFDGVLTVVLKLFNLVRPQVAIFGQKDAQQLAMIRRMVADLDVPVRVVGAPTMREPDGLALSSRNRYLGPEDRRTGLYLSRALAEGRATAAQGPSAVRRAARRVLEEAAEARPPLRLDYLALVDPATFAEIGEDYAGEAVLAVAGKVGTTRLIDNMSVTFLPRTARG
nr:pantoate--beta-alanine ligase [Bailinhaonella thermotolerans]